LDWLRWTCLPIWSTGGMWLALRCLCVPCICGGVHAFDLVVRAAWRLHRLLHPGHSSRQGQSALAQRAGDGAAVDLALSEGLASTRRTLARKDNMNLHGQIMNLQAGVPPDTTAAESYKLGHREARHVAAELATKADVLADAARTKG
jgi:hypothetical protein